jgi:predicted dehydrogenase
MDRKIKTVIIGMGRMGQTRYHAMVRHGGYEIAGICDTNTANMVSYDVPQFQDWQECIDTCKPEAVVVCTINQKIPEIVCAALEQGMDVFSEKPPGRTLEDALHMQQVQQATGQVLKFGFNHRVHNSIIEAKALIDSGMLGDIVCVRGVYGKAGSENFPREWRNRLELSGGGILLDQGIHMIDLICYLTKSDLHVISGKTDNLVWKDMETEDSAIALLETDSHQLVSLHSSAVQWKHKFDMDIVCTTGYIALNGFLTSTRSYGEESITYYKKDLQMRTGRLGKPKEHTMCFDEDFSWDIEMQDFYKVVTGDKALENGKPEDAVRARRIIQEIYEYKIK